MGKPESHSDYERGRRDITRYFDTLNNNSLESILKFCARVPITVISAARLMKVITAGLYTSGRSAAHLRLQPAHPQVSRAPGPLGLLETWSVGLLLE